MRNLFLLATFLFSEMSLGTPAHGNSCLVAGKETKKSENLLSVLTEVPTPAFIALDQKGKTRFVSPASLYADVLSISEKSLILNDLEELRFLSQTLARSEILLVLKGQDRNESFTEDKLSKVLSVSKLMQIKVNVIWLNEQPIPSLIRDLALKSGGAHFETRDLVKRAHDKCEDSIASR